jgi:hypothetical protein
MSREVWRALSPGTCRHAPANRDDQRAGRRPRGAGSGLATLAAARTLPEAKTLAVEPSVALRAVLLAKLADNPDAARRVTVVDSDAQHAPLPKRIGTVLGHEHDRPSRPSRSPRTRGNVHAKAGASRTDRAQPAAARPGDQRAGQPVLRGHHRSPNLEKAGAEPNLTARRSSPGTCATAPSTATR